MDGSGQTRRALLLNGQKNVLRPVLDAVFFMPLLSVRTSMFDLFQIWDATVLGR